MRLDHPSNWQMYYTYTTANPVLCTLSSLHSRLDVLVYLSIYLFNRSKVLRYFTLCYASFLKMYYYLHVIAPRFVWFLSLQRETWPDCWLRLMRGAGVVHLIINSSSSFENTVVLGIFWHFTLQRRWWRRRQALRRHQTSGTAHTSVIWASFVSSFPPVMRRLEMIVFKDSSLHINRYAARAFLDL